MKKDFKPENIKSKMFEIFEMCYRSVNVYIWTYSTFQTEIMKKVKVGYAKWVRGWIFSYLGLSQEHKVRARGGVHICGIRTLTHRCSYSQ